MLTKLNISLLKPIVKQMNYKIIWKVISPSQTQLEIPIRRKVVEKLKNAYKT